MSDTKHSTGPWHEGSHRTVESQNGTICEVYSHMGIEEADANQKLIAAAPDLLEALEQISHAEAATYDDIHAAIADLVGIARTAIAKATGGVE